MVLPADANVAKHLHIRKGAAVVLIESIGKVDGRPISIVAHHFPAKRFPDMIEIYKRERPVTKAFAHYGIGDYTRKETRITAPVPHTTEAALQALLMRPARLLAVAVNSTPEHRHLVRRRGDGDSERTQV